MIARVGGLVAVVTFAYLRYGCGAVLTLRKDGHRAPPALDPGGAWFPLTGI